MSPKASKKANKTRNAGKKGSVVHPHVFRFHGPRLRGIDFHPGSTTFEGRFGRMFRTLPPAEFDVDDLKNLAGKMVAQR